MVIKMRDKLFAELRRHLSGSPYEFQETTHVKQVLGYAKKLIGPEGGSRRIVVPASILHDIANYDPKFKDTQTLLRYVEDLMGEWDYSPGDAEQIVRCIMRHSRRSPEKPETPNEKIVFDADNLTILTPYGVARWFFMAREWGDVNTIERTIQDLIRIRRQIERGELFYTETGLRLARDNVWFSEYTKELSELM